MPVVSEDIPRILRHRCQFPGLLAINIESAILVPNSEFGTSCIDGRWLPAFLLHSDNIGGFRQQPRANREVLLIGIQAQHIRNVLKKQSIKHRD